MSTAHEAAGGRAVVRLATVNLLHGMVLRTGDARDTGSLRAAANGLGADIVALQEVDTDQPRSGLVDQAALFAATAGLGHHVFRAAVDGTPGQRWVAASREASEVPGPRYGVALASRWPLTDVRFLDLGRGRAGIPLILPNGRPTLVADEPRVAVAARVDTPLGPLTVASTHLSFLPGWNLVQLMRLLRWLAAMPGPRLLLGDLNMPAFLARSARGWQPLAAAATYPSVRPRIQFDHILASGSLPGVVTGTRVHRMPISDHCALSITLAGAAA